MIRTDSAIVYMCTKCTSCDVLVAADSSIEAAKAGTFEKPPAWIGCGLNMCAGKKIPMSAWYVTKKEAAAMMRGWMDAIEKFKLKPKPLSEYLFANGGLATKAWQTAVVKQ